MATEISSSLLASSKSSSSVVSTSKTSKTVSSSTTMSVSKKQTSYDTMTSKQSSSKVVTSSGGEEGSGLDFEAEIARMQEKLDKEMTSMKLQAMQSLLPRTAGIQADEDLVKLDHQSIQQYVSPDDKSRVQLSFDVKEFQKESVVVQSAGNKIEVRAKKMVQQGDNEATEEYTRTYELPEGMNTQQLSSGMDAGGDTFTVELPLITVTTQ